MATVTTPWNVRDYGSEHPLTNAQLQQLSIDYDFPRDRLDEMGGGLAFALSPRTGQFDLLLPRAADQKGQREFDRAMAEIARAEKQFAQAIDRLETIDISDPNDFPKKATPSSTLIGELRKTHTLMGMYGKLLTVNVGRRGSTPSYPGVADKRLLRDFRRRILCKTILRSWVESGRKLTITSDNTTSVRSGILIDFVNAIVSMVTTPATSLNGETLRLEVDNFKDALQQERELEERRKSV